MANIVTNDVRTYVKELVSKEFNPAAKNGHKIETGGEPEERYPERTLFAWGNRQDDISDNAQRGCLTTFPQKQRRAERM